MVKNTTMPILKNLRISGIMEITLKATKNNGFIIRGRSDATLNPGGVRIGTAEIYQQVENIEFITEGLVVGQNFKNDEELYYL